MAYESSRNRSQQLSNFLLGNDYDDDRRKRLRMNKSRIFGVTKCPKNFLDESISKYEAPSTELGLEDGGIRIFAKLFRPRTKVPDHDVANSPSSDSGSNSDPEDFNTTHISKGQSDTQYFRSKLMAACETDLGIIYACVNFSAGSLPVDQKPPAQSLELQKVSNLHFMLTRFGFFETVLWDATLKALVDLCRLENDVILYRSLRVLHRALTYVCPMVSGSNTRVGDNVKVEGSSSKKYSEKTFCLQSDDEFSRRIRNALPKTDPDWIAVFELMSKIATRKIEECTRLEAVSIMNLLLQSTKAYGRDRKSFGRVLDYQTIIQLLDKESGVDFQKEAVKLIFLLLNCPELKSTFLSACKNVFENAKEATTAKVVDAQDIGGIINGFLGLVPSCTAGLKLRREAIKLWAFLATSGQLEFEVFVPYLELILQMLVSAVDVVDPCIYDQPEVLKERTLLIREILIYINQLLSHPRDQQITLIHMIYGKLSNGLGVYITGILSRDTECLLPSDELTRRMTET